MLTKSSGEVQATDLITGFRTRWSTLIPIIAYIRSLQEQPMVFYHGAVPAAAVFVLWGKKKAGRAVADLSEFWRGEKEIKLLDANLLTCPD